VLAMPLRRPHQPEQDGMRKEGRRNCPGTGADCVTCSTTASRLLDAIGGLELRTEERFRTPGAPACRQWW